MPIKSHPCVVMVPYEGKQKRICKVIPLADEGFSMTPPAHKAKSGVLLKSPYLSNVGTIYIPESEFIPFTASDRVKLSYHPDGFVQFSSAGSSSIISGRDENGVPRGVGVVAATLNNPINTGPSISIAAWGLHDFQDGVTRKKENVVNFDDQDLYTDQFRENTSSESIPGFEVSFIVFRTNDVEKFVQGFDTNQRVVLRPPRWLIAPCRELPARLIKVSDLVTLAVIVRMDAFRFNSASGYRMAGPSDFKHHIHAIYPPHAPGGANLDYQKAH